MRIGNRIVAAMLQSPLHRLLGRRIALVRYVGRRSGVVVTLPVQYVRTDDAVVVAAGDAAAKRWWRNFREPANATLLLDGRWWHECELHVIESGEEHDVAAATYVAAFPSAMAHLDGAVLLTGRLR